MSRVKREDLWFAPSNDGKAHFVGLVLVCVLATQLALPFAGDCQRSRGKNGADLQTEQSSSKLSSARKQKAEETRGGDSQLIASSGHRRHKRRGATEAFDQGKASDSVKAGKGSADGAKTSASKRGKKGGKCQSSIMQQKGSAAGQKFKWPVKEEPGSSNGKSGSQVKEESGSSSNGSAEGIPGSKTSKKESSEKASSDTDRKPAEIEGYEERTKALSKAYALRDLALNEVLNGDYGLAVKHLAQATQFSRDYYYNGSPAEALLYLDLAQAAEKAGQDDLAQRSFAEAANLNPHLFEGHLGLARLHARLNHPTQALEEARKATAQAPSDPRAHLVLSLILERQGQIAEAHAEKAKAQKLLEASSQITVLEKQTELAPQKPPGADQPIDGEPGLVP